MSRKGGSLGCIWFEETKMKYQDAKAFCEGKNSILFEPSGPEEAREVIKAYQNGKSDTHSFTIPPQKPSVSYPDGIEWKGFGWIGGFKDGRTYKWESGREWTYTDWKDSQPSQQVRVPESYTLDEEDLLNLSETSDHTQWLETCIELVTVDDGEGNWNDINCDALRQPICHKPPQGSKKKRQKRSTVTLEMDIQLVVPKDKSRASEPWIEGGTNAQEGFVPSVVSLQAKVWARPSDGTGPELWMCERHYCGGTLIRLDSAFLNNRVLTAAHCCMYFAANSQELFRNDIYVHSGGLLVDQLQQKSKVLNFITHPQAFVPVGGKNRTTNDICVMKVEDFNIVPNVTEAAYLATDNASHTVPPGWAGFMAGWGNQANTALQPLKHLQIATQRPYESLDQCRQVLVAKFGQDFTDYVVGDRSLCTHPLNNGMVETPCDADSGDPLYISFFNNRWDTVLAVHTGKTGSLCKGGDVADNDLPNKNEYVPAHWRWIQAEMASLD